jgi:hypothetical protein
MGNGARATQCHRFLIVQVFHGGAGLVLDEDTDDHDHLLEKCVVGAFRATPVG